MIDESAALARDVGDDWLLACGLLGKSQAHYVRGLPLRARPFAEEAVALARRSGSALLRRSAEGQLAFLMYLEGRASESAALIESVIAESREERAPIGWCLGMLAANHANTGCLDSARTYAAEGLEVAPASDYAGDRIPPMVAAAMIASAEGDPAAVAQWAELNDLVPVPLSSEVVPGRAEAEIDNGMTDEARAHLEEALPAMRDWACGVHLAAALLAKGRLDADEDALHEGLAIASEHGGRGVVVLALERIAGMAAAAESYAEAARLLAAAGAARERLGTVPFASQGADREATTTIARDGLGEEAFAAAWNEGEAMSLDDAVSYAQRGRGERKRPSSGWASLTPAELDVVKLVAGGLTNPQIAERLFITRNTVRAHLQHVFAKLGVKTRAELASEATRRGV